MPTHDGFSCYVLSEGQRLPEFEGPDVTETPHAEHATVVTRWIPAKTGERFTIEVKGPRDTTYSRIIRIYLDDLRCKTSSRAFKPDRNARALSLLRTTARREGEVYNMAFADMDATEAEATPGMDKASLGTILVTIQNATRSSQTQNSALKYGLDKTLAQGYSVPEKDKKCLTHQVQLCPVPANEQKATRSIVHTDKKHPPFLVFKFMYRNLELLQAMGYAPQAPRHDSVEQQGRAYSPNSVVVLSDEEDGRMKQETDFDQDDLYGSESDEDRKTLLIKQRDLKEAAKKLADEAQAVEDELKRNKANQERKRGRCRESGSSSNKRVKAEEKPHIIPPDIIGQIFDLTDD